ncbi:hypothetical protein WDZ16_10305 [Pseudokineococcus marinus]|uniref:Uncharacterized protein n=1 Tax=Pseudokineococcus marinus TaxID=351215 RepID=A0A849BEW1_9ACTN|nr:hypothetical protein [Pseudokineococcus marinus]NNH21590.1 hypothetical protein [Pseudokineococcus marinus]
MTAADFVIQPGAGSRPARIADVIGQPPQDPESTVMAQVTWRDDDRTQVVTTRPPMVRTREGSNAFHLAVDPTAVRERCAETPDRVLAALLAGRPATDQNVAGSLLKEEDRVAPESLDRDLLRPDQALDPDPRGSDSSMASREPLHNGVLSAATLRPLGHRSSRTSRCTSAPAVAVLA